MKPSNVKAVKTPGELTQTDGEANEAPPSVPAVLPTDPVALAALVAAEVAKALRQRDPARPLVKEAALPDQSEIDPSQIKEAVLTKQGYVVPSNLGARPAHLQNLV